MAVLISSHVPRDPCASRSYSPGLHVIDECSPGSGSMWVQLVCMAPDPSQTWHFSVPSRLQPVQFLPVPLHSSHLIVPSPWQVGHSFMVYSRVSGPGSDLARSKRVKWRPVIECRSAVAKV